MQPLKFMIKGKLHQLNFQQCPTVTQEQIYKTTKKKGYKIFSQYNFFVASQYHVQKHWEAHQLRRFIKVSCLYK